MTFDDDVFPNSHWYAGMNDISTNSNLTLKSTDNSVVRNQRSILTLYNKQYRLLKSFFKKINISFPFSTGYEGWGIWLG